MNMQTTVQTNGLLASRAMLSSLTIRQWQARKLDKRATAETLETNHANSDSGRFTKALVDKTAVKSIAAAAGDARAAHYKHTLPWLDNGARILPAKAYDTYCKAVHKAKTAFEDAVRDFQGAYTAHVQAARRSLGDLFDEADYPPASDLEDAFAFDVRILPIPDAADFRVELDADQAGDIRRDIEAANRQALDGAMKDTQTRIMDAVSHMIERLRAYQPGDDGQRASGTFKASLVDNVRELVDILPALNLTNDSRLDALVEAMRADLCGHDAQELREDETLRATTADAAQRILELASDFLG
jgi:hypothetical protein